MSAFRALTATTGTTAGPPFLAPLVDAPVEVAEVVLAFDHRYHAPAPNKARTGSHSHRALERRCFGDFVTVDLAGRSCSTAGGVFSFMSSPVGCWRHIRNTRSLLLFSIPAGAE